MSTPLLYHWPNHDFASGIIPFVPYPALQRLAVTSKWIKITKSDIKQALERHNELFGKAVIVLQPPYDSFHGEGVGSCVRILDQEENTLEIGRKEKTSDLVTVKWGGCSFTGTPKEYMQFKLVHFLEDTVSMLSGEKEDFCVWFEIICSNTIRVKFCGNHWTTKPTKENPAVFDVQLMRD